LHPYSYELRRLRKQGLSPEEVENKDLLSEIEVERVMVRDVIYLKEKMSFQEMRDVIDRTRHTGYPVLNDDGLLVGLLTAADLTSELSPQAEPTLHTVGSMMRKPVRTVIRDASLRSAIRAMRESGQDRVPVVDSLNPQRMIGLVSRSQIMTAYERNSRK
jgi:CIC family chloride channel protein